jgi:hypothetical protein
MDLRIKEAIVPLKMRSPKKSIKNAKIKPPTPVIKKSILKTNRVKTKTRNTKKSAINPNDSDK